MVFIPGINLGDRESNFVVELPRFLFCGVSWGSARFLSRPLALNTLHAPTRGAAGQHLSGDSKLSSPAGGWGGRNKTGAERRPQSAGNQMTCFLKVQKSWRHRENLYNLGVTHPPNRFVNLI